MSHLAVTLQPQFSRLSTRLGTMVITGGVILNVEIVRIRSSVSKKESLETKLSYQPSHNLIHHSSSLLNNIFVNVLC